MTDAPYLTRDDAPSAEEVVEARKASTDLKDKPTLNATERRALKDLVDNDFQTLEQRLHRAYADRQHELERTAQKRAAEERERAQDVIDRMGELNEKQRKERERFIAQAEKKGVTIVSSGRGQGLVFSGIPSSMEEEKRNLSRDYEAARTALREQWLAASRLILLTGVPATGPARDVLDSIPSAETLMAQVAAERQRKAVTAKAPRQTASAHLPKGTFGTANGRPVDRFGHYLDIHCEDVEDECEAETHFHGSDVDVVPI